MRDHGPLDDIVGLLARASLRSGETQRVLVHRLLAERDRLEPSERGLAGCLHAAAVLAKVAPGLEDESLTDVQRILRDLVRFVNGSVPAPAGTGAGKGPRNLNDARLGEVLVELGFVEQADIDEALHRGGDGRLGDRLVEMGRVSRRDIEAAENLHRSMVGRKDQGSASNG